MRLMLYHPGNSWIHRLSPGYKLLTVMIISSALMMMTSFVSVLLTLVVVFVAYKVASIPLPAVFHSLKPMLWFLVIILTLQLFFTDWVTAIYIITRLFTLILLTLLLTFTTKTSDLVDTIEWALNPLQRWGVNTKKVSLAISLTIRFVPIISIISTQIKEAQSVRGLDKNVFAMIIPLTLRTLKMADDIADAIDARLF